MLLSVNNLSVSFHESTKAAGDRSREGAPAPHPSSKEAATIALRNLSFAMDEGDITGLIGHSGAGKTLTALALMGLLPVTGAVVRGEIFLDGKDLCALSGEERRSLRGKTMAMIFQEPMSALNPVMRVGRQVEEVLRLHTALSQRERRERAMAALSEVELPAERVYRAYPHELSGGMCQRVMIAAAIMARPKLLLADEPTTALDSATQADILRLLRRLNEKYGMGILFITHDLTAAAGFCRKILVMRDGEIIESGETRAVLSKIQTARTQVPPARRAQEAPSVSSQAQPALTVSRLCVSYKKKPVLSDISFSIAAGETVGLMGKSGSGKTTLANAVLGLIPRDSGDVCLPKAGAQMVFQDPYAALNPQRRIGWILEEPLRAAGIPKEERKRSVLRFLRRVQLPADYASRYAKALSGGECQRVGLALALIGGARLIVLDEALAALDLPVRREMLALLASLQSEYGLAYLFISHDEATTRSFCDRVLYLEEGTVAESKLRGKSL